MWTELGYVHWALWLGSHNIDAAIVVGINENLRPLANYIDGIGPITGYDSNNNLAVEQMKVFKHGITGITN